MGILQGLFVFFLFCGDSMANQKRDLMEIQCGNQPFYANMMGYRTNNLMIFGCV